VYSGNTAPSKLPEETKMNKDPLKIILDSPKDKLDPKSRINLGKIITIDHNVKVKPIGSVDERSLVKLLHYVSSIRNS
jgi:mRNA-degrading endonuclease toxin of MazEF toxin-antitoxin module